MSEENKALIRHLIYDILDAGEYDRVEEVVAIEHITRPLGHRGPEGYRQAHEILRASFPDLHMDIEHVVAEGNLLAFHAIFSGTHKGTYHFRHIVVAPTGKRIEWRNIQFPRIENGMFVEGWHVNDDLGMLE